MNVLKMLITSAILTLPLVEHHHLSAQTLTLYYGNNQTINNCRIMGVTEFNVTLEHTPLLPGVYFPMNVSMESITGIREVSRANKVAPYLAFVGSFMGVHLFFEARDPIDEMTLSERLASWLDTPLNFLSCVCIGGAVGYFGSHYLLGGNRELIVMDKMPLPEKQLLLAKYIAHSRNP